MNVFDSCCFCSFSTFCNEKKKQQIRIGGRMNEAALNECVSVENKFADFAYDICM